jgi:hypothetical protein
MMPATLTRIPQRVTVAVRKDAYALRRGPICMRAGISIFAHSIPEAGTLARTET